LNICDYCGSVLIEVGGELVCINCGDIDEMEKTPKITTLVVIPNSTTTLVVKKRE